MAKYQCTVCNDLFDEDIEKIDFLSLPKDWVCPKCSLPAKFFNKVFDNEKAKSPEDIVLYNAVEIMDDNICIQRIKEKCIDCGLCKLTCQSREKIKNFCNGKNCVNCGQCIQVCPVGAIIPKDDIDKVTNALHSEKICVVYTAPGVRVSLGEAFHMPEGSFVQGKLISALRKLGFKYVLDLTFGADLTIIEETTELVKRIQTCKNLPMFTSCCPAWVKYAVDNYPEIIPNLSTCKSPIGMQEAVIRTYYAEKLGIKPEQLFTVAIAPCTAKKYERTLKMGGPDIILTTRELARLIKMSKIDFLSLEDSQYDSMLGEGSGAGMIFGNTGGVMEAALRTVYKVVTNENLKPEDIVFKDVRGLSNVKETSINLNGFILKVAVINQMASAIPLIEDVIKGKSKYHFIEIMNCLGGCVGGGGQIGYQKDNELLVKQKRISSLYAKDDAMIVKCSHQNPDVFKLYQDLLEKPMSNKAKELLHSDHGKGE